MAYSHNLTLSLLLVLYAGSFPILPSQLAVYSLLNGTDIFSCLVAASLLSQDR